MASAYGGLDIAGKSIAETVSSFRQQDQSAHLHDTFILVLSQRKPMKTTQRVHQTVEVLAPLGSLVFDGMHGKLSATPQHVCYRTGAFAALSAKHLNFQNLGLRTTRGCVSAPVMTIIGQLKI